MTDTLEDDAFAHLSLESVRVHYAVPVVDSSRTAIVVVSQPNQSREPQKLATVLAARLSDAVGEEVVVRVQYRTYQYSNGTQIARSAVGQPPESPVRRSSVSESHTPGYLSIGG